MNETPLLIKTWEGPMGGVPLLNRVTADHLRAALEAAMAQEDREISSLRALETEGTFEDSILAIERLGSALSHAHALYSNWSSSFTSDELRALRQEMEPRLTARHDHLYGDVVLYKRVAHAAQDPSLTPAQKRLATRITERFEDAGAHLPEETRDDVARINQRLSALYTIFSDHVIADEEELVTWLTQDQLDGLSAGWCAHAKSTAEAHGRPEKWAVQNTRSAVEPLLKLSPHREVRRQVWTTFYERGATRSTHQNLPIADEILKLRARRATLLGFETHAHQVLHRTMAGTPEAAMTLLRQVWVEALTAFERDLAVMTELARGEGFTGELEPWDVRYYGEKVRRRDHDIDPNEVRQYFSLERLREGMFWAAERCFGWRFQPADVPLPHPDVTAWQIHDRSDDEVGLFYLDPFARTGKRSGAWMSTYRVQSWNEEGRVPPLVINTCNFLKGGDDVPATLSQSDARTLFHEFGHAMHGLASASPYPSLAGTSVVRDFVEFPSQLNERWLNTSELRERFCTHIETGAPLPDSLALKLQRAANAKSAFDTLEYLASAVVDMSLHLEGAEADPSTVEERVLHAWGLPSQIVMRHRVPHFAHIFSGGWYAAGYYCYLWADTLVADAAEAFAEEGFYNTELATRYYDLLLSQGGLVDASEGFRQFRGRDPSVEPLLRDRGFITPAEE